MTAEPDPNATLARVRELVTEIREDRVWRDDELAGRAYILADHVHALDQWLTRQGYLPQPDSPTDRLVGY